MRASTSSNIIKVTRYTSNAVYTPDIRAKAFRLQIQGAGESAGKINNINGSVS